MTLVLYRHYIYMEDRVTGILSHRNIESQEAEAMRQQAEHGLTDAW